MARVLHYAHHVGPKGNVVSACNKQCRSGRYTTAAIPVLCEDCKSTDFWKNREGGWLRRKVREGQPEDVPVEVILPEKMLEGLHFKDGKLRPKYSFNKAQAKKRKKPSIRVGKGKAYQDYLGLRRIG